MNKLPIMPWISFKSGVGLRLLFVRFVSPIQAPLDQLGKSEFQMTSAYSFDVQKSKFCRIHKQIPV